MAAKKENTKAALETMMDDLNAEDLEALELTDPEAETGKKAPKKTAAKKSAASSAKKEERETSMLGIVIPRIDVKEITFKVVGTSSLIVHAWSEKAKKMMLDKQMKKASAGREAKNPFQDYCDSAYWLTPKPENPTPEDVANARFGFPAIAFKACAIDAGYQQGILAKKTTSRGAFHMIDELVEIHGDPVMREDMVMVGGMTKTADIRYRMEFQNWWAEIRIRYNANAISPEQIANLLNMGGFSNGIGEWRPSRDGAHGTFTVAIE